jgi:guanylate kinase
MLDSGSILILSGPSGCGKSSLLKEVYKHINNYYFSISTTTRDPRVGEKDGVDYFFVSKEEFEQDIKENSFLEYANVHNNYYGTSLKPIKKALIEKKLVIFDIDVQGHTLAREQLNELITSVFITTPTLDILEKRLTSRGTDDLEVIKNRIKNAKMEINSIDKYDYIIINDDLKIAAKELVAIAITSKKKISLFDKNNIINNWLR